MQDTDTASLADRTMILRDDVGLKAFIRRLQIFLHGNPTTIPALVLLISVVLFSALIGSRFFAAYNLSLVLQQITIIAIVGVAQTLVILTAGIDLSVGGILALSSVIMGQSAFSAGLPIILVFPIGLLVGLTCGCINGLLVTALRCRPSLPRLERGISSTGSASGFRTERPFARSISNRRRRFCSRPGIHSGSLARR